MIRLGTEVGSRRLTRKVTSSVAWSGTLHSVILAVNLVITAILARLLAPSDFGVIAGAMIFLSAAQLISRSGIFPALVQLPELTVSVLRGGFTLAVLLALLTFGLTQLLAPIAASFLRLEMIEPVLRVLAFVLVIEALSLVAEAVLIRRLEVRWVMVVELGGRIVGSGAVGISLAYLGLGYWALVAAALADASVKGISLVCLVRPPFRPLMSREIARCVAPKSFGFTLRRLFNFIATNADRVVVGRYFDAAGLGIYSRAYHLMNEPAALYDKVATRVAFPAMARVQHEPARLKAAFLRGLSLSATFGLPLCTVVFILARDIVLLLLGSQWLDVVPIFLVLAASMYLRLGAKVSNALLTATGSVVTLVAIQALFAASVILASLLGYPHGLPALAGAIAFAILIHFCIISAAGCKRTRVSAGEFANAHLRGLALAALAGLLTWGAAAPWWHFDIEGLAPIASSGMALALLCFVLAVFRPNILLGPDGAEFLLNMQALIARRLRLLPEWAGGSAR